MSSKTFSTHSCGRRSRATSGKCIAPARFCARTGHNSRLGVRSENLAKPSLKERHSWGRHYIFPVSSLPYELHMATSRFATTPPARPRQATHLPEPLSQVSFPEAAKEKPEGRYDVIAGVINECLLLAHFGQTPLAGHGLSPGQSSGGLALALQCSAPPPLGRGYVPAIAIPQSPWPPVSFMILPHDQI